MCDRFRKFKETTGTGPSQLLDHQHVFGMVSKEIEELAQSIVLCVVTIDIADAELVVDGDVVLVCRGIDDVAGSTLKC